MPTRRAVAGAALITVAAAGVLVAHRSASTPPSSRYIVATASIPAGHRLQADDLGSVAIDLPGGVAAVPESAADDLVGRITRAPLSELAMVRPGDVFEPGRFTGAGLVEVALELDPARALSGTVAVGDLVDVLSTDPEGSGTSRIASGVRVSQVGDDVAGGIGSTGSVLIRLGVPDAQTAATVVDASIRSQITLVLPAPTEERQG